VVCVICGPLVGFVVKPRVYIFGWPGVLGGADTKLHHLLLLLHECCEFTVVWMQVFAPGWTVPVRLRSRRDHRAPEDGRSPRRCARAGALGETRQRLGSACGPPPLWVDGTGRAQSKTRRPVRGLGPTGAAVGR
jgi:hypothetical protein